MQMLHDPRSFAAAAVGALLCAAPLAAQHNATSELMTYGDVLGAPCEVRVHGLTPGAPCFVFFSRQTGPNNALVNQTGDPADQLQVGLEFALRGRYLSGTVDPTGEFQAAITLPANTAFVDQTVYFQAFTRPGGAGAPFYNDFSNLRATNLNQAGRWQNAAANDWPIASANLAWAVDERGTDGGALRVFLCGGGPSLLADANTPYPTTKRAWWFDARRLQHQPIGPTMNEGRAFHNVVRLQDGRFLAIGGANGPFGTPGAYYAKILRSAEIYDPVADAWSPAANMNAHRAGANAMLLPNGRVLVTGGAEGNSAHELSSVTDLLGTALKSTEIYDPSSDTWSPGPNLPEFKAAAMDTWLNDGRWLVAGGITHTLLFGIPIPDFSANVSIFDPVSMSWADMGDKLKDKRALGGVAVLSGGGVFFAGGAGGDIFNIGPIKKTELYNPTANVSAAKPDLSEPSAFNVCRRLPGGRILIVGGAKGAISDPVPIASCWIYTNAGATLVTIAPMPETRAGGAVELLEDGTVYAAGGESNSGTATAQARSWTP